MCRCMHDPHCCCLWSIKWVLYLYHIVVVAIVLTVSPTSTNNVICLILHHLLLSTENKSVARVHTIEGS
jgi:hypothetical protein